VQGGNSDNTKTGRHIAVTAGFARVKYNKKGLETDDVTPEASHS